MNKSVILPIIAAVLMIYVSPSIAITSGFDSNSVNDVKFTEIKNNVQLVKSNKEYIGNKSIRSFDINRDGQIAIGFMNNTINVYDSNGLFKYNYTYQTDGSSQILFDYQNSNLMIYFVREKWLISFDSSGEIREIFETEKTQKNVLYFLSLRERSEISTGDATYKMVSAFGSGKLAVGFAKIEKYMIGGKSLVIYDALNLVQKRIVILTLKCIFTIIIVLASIAFIIKGFITIICKHKLR